MEELLNLFSENLQKRYYTLLKNIRYKSNSFYDAYNDLIEELLREIAVKELKLVDLRGSIHDILNISELKGFMLNELNISNTSLNKLLDYASKLNKHKHTHEHDISLTLCLKYFKLLYDLIYAYAKYKGISIICYNEDYIINLYGLGYKENEELKLQVLKLKEELKPEKYESLIKDGFNNLDIKAQNDILLREVNKLKDIKLSSLEVKLNKSLEMLLNLNELVKENKRISKGVANMIGGNLLDFMDSDDDE